MSMLASSSELASPASASSVSVCMPQPSRVWSPIMVPTSGSIHARPGRTDGAGPPAASLTPASRELQRVPHSLRRRQVVEHPHRVPGPAGAFARVLCRANHDRLAAAAANLTLLAATSTALSATMGTLQAGRPCFWQSHRPSAACFQPPDSPLSAFASLVTPATLPPPSDLNCPFSAGFLAARVLP
jgi:hypothetical protein